jgi:hypothetical protein
MFILCSPLVSYKPNSCTVSKNIVKDDADYTDL